LGLPVLLICLLDLVNIKARLIHTTNLPNSYRIKSQCICLDDKQKIIRSYNMVMNNR